MSTPKTLEAGQRVTVKTFDPSGRRVALRGEIEDLGPSSMIVGLESQDLGFALREGADVLVECENGAERATFTTSVIDVRLAGRMRLRLAAPETIKRLRSRSAGRTGVRLDLSYARLDDKGNARERRRTQTQEISAKGASIVTARALPRGTRLTLDLDLRELGTCSIEAEVRNNRPGTEPDGPQNECGVEFVGMSPQGLVKLQEFLRATRKGR